MNKNAIFKLAFPNSYNFPFFLNKSRCYFRVSTFITGNLITPVFFIVFRLCVPTVMSMPKATIKKYGYFLFRKNKIWLTV